MQAQDRDQHEALEKRHGKRNLAPITPDVLVWARESIGASLNDAAKKAGVTPERVEGWERGDDKPTAAML
ncbi:MAG: helix-turn-helix transcriptional regulator [Acidimicrobiia bacterium]|nr:helix-turn-helix transcriptional regulator [Acidimicrobiia bacterium]MYC58197.1 helix-turn-helix transcriptional regulator [Acidimicrobiia bacterium]MYI30629.1 helix-turn-helix transcriptional regulator [Acidimicrobiia bacterium]